MLALLAAFLTIAAAGCDQSSDPGAAETAAARPTPSPFALRSHRLVEKSAPLVTPIKPDADLGETEPTVPAVAVAVSAEPHEGSAPLRVSFHADVQGGPLGLQYRWDFGDDGPPAHQLRVQHTYTSAGTYTAVLTVSGAGSEQTGQVHIAVSAPTFDLAIDADPDIGKAPLTVRFSATFNDDLPGPFSYQWDFGDGGHAGGNPTIYTYPVPGQYSASLLVTDGQGRSAGADVQIQVDSRDAEEAP